MKLKEYCIGQLLAFAVVTLPAVADNTQLSPNNPSEISCTERIGARKTVFIDSDNCDGAGVQLALSPDTPLLQGVNTGSLSPEEPNDTTSIPAIYDANYSLRHPNILANIEALLNILANLFEIIGLVAGIGAVGRSLLRRSLRDFLWGLGFTALGISFPGFVNWLVASARDANLLG